MNVLIIAGDRKNYFLYKKMLSNGYLVTLVGFDHIRSRSSKKTPALNLFDVVITPIPFTLDGLTLYSPYADNTYHIDSFLDMLKPNSVIVGGPFKRNDSRFIDITKNQDFLNLNVLPVCEELIKIVIDKTDITLIGSSILLYGYGSVTKRLYKLLEFLGAYVHIKSDKLDIEEPSSTMDNIDSIDEYDVIINTQTGFIIDNSILDLVKNETVIIDACSSGSGLDYSYAKKQNIKAIKARGLTGKSAPKTVSEYLFNTLRREKII